MTTENRNHYHCTTDAYWRRSGNTFTTLSSEEKLQRLVHMTWFSSGILEDYPRGAKWAALPPSLIYSSSLSLSLLSVVRCIVILSRCQENVSCATSRRPTPKPSLSMTSSERISSLVCSFLQPHYLDFATKSMRPSGTSRIPSSAGSISLHSGSMR